MPVLFSLIEHLQIIEKVSSSVWLSKLIKKYFCWFIAYVTYYISIVIFQTQNDDAKKNLAPNDNLFKLSSSDLNKTTDLTNSQKSHLPDSSEKNLNSFLSNGIR